MNTLFNPPNKNITVLLLAMCGLSALFISLRFSEYVIGSVGDDAIYTEMARSIAEGRGPIIYLSECVNYLPFAFPAGYPLLLSPIALLFPNSLQPLQLLSLLLPLSAIPFYYICQYLSISRSLSLGAISLFVINPWTITYANRVLSESTYTFFSFLSLLAYIKWQQSQSPLSKLLPIVILAVGLSASMRTVGLALAAAMLLHLLIRHKWPYFIALFLGLALSLSPQFILNAQRGGSIISPGYKAQTVDHVRNISGRWDFMTDNARGYIDELPAALAPIFGNQVRHIAIRYGVADLYSTILLLVGLLLFLLISWGIWGLLRRHTDTSIVIGLYLGLYSIALLNFSGWPSGVQLRLLVPILPILYLLLVVGSKDMLSKVTFLPSATIYLVVAAITALSIAHNTYRTTHAMSQARSHSGRGFVDYSAGSSWIRTHTQPSDTILSTLPLERHIHFNRPFVGIPGTARDVSHLPIDRCNVSFLFIAPGNADSPDYLDASEQLIKNIAMTNPHIFELVYEDQSKAISIYKFNKDKLN